ncbi:MAG: primosomal protein N' [Tissierellia bacterium]|nr:primosomal protein N' [Tissierellia bacterium]
MYVDLLINRNVLSLDRLFTYKVPENLTKDIEIGKRVSINFSNSLTYGLVLNIRETIEDKDFKIKEIINILDYRPIIDKELIKLGLWMKEFYLLTYAKAFEPIISRDIKDIYYLFLKGKKYLTIDSVETKDFIDKLLNKSSDEIINILKDNSLKEKIDELENLGYIDLKTTSVKNTHKIYDYKIEILMDRELAFAKLARNATRQIQTLEILYSEDIELKYNELKKEYGIDISLLKNLEAKGILKLTKLRDFRDVFLDTPKTYPKHKLNEEQTNAYEKIKASDEKLFLLHGVTGSGKTEVYLQLIEDILKEDKNALVLVPEISLTPQMVERFRGRFGKIIGVIHSGLSKSEKSDELERIRLGQVRIVIGARSAIFAPIKDLGIIIIDEEHDNSYKMSENLKYNVIDIAKYRVNCAKNAKLVLGSATPNLGDYYRSQQGEYQLLELKNRAMNTLMPKVNIVDMRRELKAGNNSIFSYDLLSAMKTALIKGEQIILFLNRRGYSNFVSCRACGHIVKCDKCDVSMVYHKDTKTMECHYCGKTIGEYNKCPVCGSSLIKYFGIGTQQIEQITKEFFPDFKIARMDRDTTRVKYGHKKILDSFKNKEIDILIGTQMIAKGLDFANVSLVGVMAADTSINMPFYNSAEESFQLITQVAGRAGRSDKRGDVIVQTYNPEHYSLLFAKNHDYEGFYLNELEIRKQFKYPPITQLITIYISGKNEQKVIDTSKRMFMHIYKNVLEEPDGIKINGPAHPDSIKKINEMYRYRIDLISDFTNAEKLKSIVYRVCIKNEYNLNINGIYVDINLE